MAEPVHLLKSASLAVGGGKPFVYLCGVSPESGEPTSIRDFRGATCVLCLRAMCFEFADEVDRYRIALEEFRDKCIEVLGDGP